MRFESSVEINASPEQVWAAVHNPAEWPHWIPSVKKIEQLTEGPLNVGTRLRIVVRTRLTITLLMTIVEFVPSERLVMRGTVMGTRLTRWYRLERANGCTRAIAGGQASGLLSWLITAAGRRLSEEIVHSFKRKVEG